MLEPDLKEQTQEHNGAVFQRSPLRRLGCLALLLVWFVVMMIPLRS
jgi:hypothetical protein